MDFDMCLASMKFGNGFYADLINFDDIDFRDISESDVLVCVQMHLMRDNEMVEKSELLKRMFFERNVFFSSESSPYSMPENILGKGLPFREKVRNIYTIGCYRGEDMCVDSQLIYLSRKGYDNLWVVDDLTPMDYYEQLTSLGR